VLKKKAGTCSNQFDMSGSHYTKNGNILDDSLGNKVGLEKRKLTNFTRAFCVLARKPRHFLGLQNRRTGSNEVFL
jgi:hypothetical protein